MPQDPIVVTLQKSGEPEEFIFRPPDFEDILLLEETFPILPNDERAFEKAKTDEDVLDVMNKSPDRMKRIAARCDFLIVRCAVRPRIVRPEEGKEDTLYLEPVDGKRSLAYLSARERMQIGLTLFGLSGYDEDAAMEIRPLSATVASSKSSIRSLTDTGDSRPMSSDSVKEKASDGSRDTSA